MKISLYIHIPFCAAKCDYCDFFSVPINGQNSLSLQKAVLETIITELKIKLENIPDPSIETVFIGGGTPSAVDPGLFHLFLTDLSAVTDGLLVPAAEFSIEANIETCGKDFISSAADGGINRLSLGVQSFRSDILKKIGRARFPDDILERVSGIKAEWGGALSMDIISGITENDILDINLATSLTPDHLSVYQLTIEEDTKLYNLVTSGKYSAPDEALQSSSISVINRVLEDEGYFRYEISNYAKTGKRCIHNLRYWEMQSYLGIGPSAVSSYYSDSSRYRTANTKDIKKYIKDVNKGFFNYQEREDLSDFDFMLEHFIMGCRLCEGINDRIFFSRFGRHPSEFIPRTIEQWKKRKLMTEGENLNASLNNEGLLFLDSFLSDVYSELSENKKSKKNIKK